jgi:ornithine cyclodeaminase/alanine dehydrogenase-like protein (mu-crystallin family)
MLTAHEARVKGRLIVAVGSYSPNMRELPTELLHQATGKQYGQGHAHLADNALDGGVIVVDTLEGVMKEAGEIIDARINPTQLVE